MKKLMLIPFAFLLASALVACNNNAGEDEEDNTEVIDENVEDTQTGDQEETEIIEDDTNTGTDTEVDVETEDGMGTNNGGTDGNGTTDNGTETEVEVNEEENQ